MVDDLKNSIAVAASGMQVQSARLKVIAQNIANSDAVATYPGDEPYRRKTISFKNELDKTMGVEKIKVDNIGVDKSPFSKIYDPGNIAADEDGYVLKTNVQREIEMMDMREAQRSYEANLSVISITKTMLAKTLELMK
jgi:flagellar basal-body rod protein FlgC